MTRYTLMYRENKNTTIYKKKDFKSINDARVFIKNYKPVNYTLGDNKTFKVVEDK